MLLGISGAILYASYHFAISNTVSVYKQYTDKVSLSKAYTDTPDLLRQLIAKEQQIDLMLSNAGNSNTSLQNRLLKELNLYCQGLNLKIISFQEPHVFQQKETDIITYSFSTEGSFNDVIALVNKIENKSSHGSIKHLQTIKKTDYSTQRNFLVTHILIEKVILRKDAH
jgi:NAD(P)H-dependent flavin oxidoreductase YrpB (nitropropane dioxygenase family)